jgi:hypothetical protein
MQLPTLGIDRYVVSRTTEQYIYLIYASVFPLSISLSGDVYSISTAKIYIHFVSCLVTSIINNQQSLNQ